MTNPTDGEGTAVDAEAGPDVGLPSSQEGSEGQAAASLGSTVEPPKRAAATAKPPAASPGVAAEPPTSRGAPARASRQGRNPWVGLGLIALSLPILLWNEGRLVTFSRDLDEARTSVKSVPPSPLDPANDGTLVHVVGTAQPRQLVTDDIFGISLDVLALERRVAMYQWRENTEEKLERIEGGTERTVTVHTYESVFASEAIDSSSFEEAEAHSNPPLPERLPSTKRWADEVHIGEFTLPHELAVEIEGEEAVHPDASVAARVQAAGVPATVAGQTYFVGANSEKPAVGDLRVEFRAIPQTEVSVLGGQGLKGLEPWRASGGTFFTPRIAQGHVGTKEMLDLLRQDRPDWLWLPRVLGWLMSLIGLALLLRALAEKKIPSWLLGLSWRRGLPAALALSITLSAIVIASAWVGYQPIVGSMLLAFACLATVGVIILLRRIAKVQP